MVRKYTLRKRAERLADTRRRIVEAAVDLHSEIGPASTTLSMIAERAGVQRHTLYAHYPDERSLLLACSGLAVERDPLPDAAPWAAIPGMPDRLCAGLTAVYGWYARNESLAACVLRDAEHHALTREMAELRFGAPMLSYRQVLGAGLAPWQKALLAVALNFHTWRTLAGEARMSPPDAACLVAAAIATAAPVRRRPRRANVRQRTNKEPRPKPAHNRANLARGAIRSYDPQD